jgi:ethanolamine utilization microcompartment shell protein EutL
MLVFMSPQGLRRAKAAKLLDEAKKIAEKEHNSVFGKHPKEGIKHLEHAVKGLKAAAKGGKNAEKDVKEAVKEIDHALKAFKKALEKYKGPPTGLHHAEALLKQAKAAAKKK